MKRYHIRNDCDCNTCLVEYDLPDGEWVRYEDAQAEIDRLKQEILEAADILDAHSNLHPLAAILRLAAQEEE